MMALGVIMQAQAEGIAVPEQLSVVGLGDQSFSRDMHPALTSVRIDGNTIGSLAADFIIARSEGKLVADPVRDIGFTIVERDSA